MSSFVQIYSAPGEDGCLDERISVSVLRMGTRFGLAKETNHSQTSSFGRSYWKSPSRLSDTPTLIRNLLLSISTRSRPATGRRFLLARCRQSDTLR